MQFTYFNYLSAYLNLFADASCCSSNVSQKRWLDTNGRVVAIRYWNGTALVSEMTG
ncbi:MAG: hypothetical protein J4469_05265 [Candidatus Aenigmarchaeota archaeon]|nr:hypothetical protein [Candidatus Aenigmarchaeota archaeon]